MLFLPTVRHVKSRVTTEQREVKTESVVHSLLSLFMEQRVVCQSGGRQLDRRGRLFICQYRGCTHRFPSFLPILLVIYTPPPSLPPPLSPPSFLFVSRPSRLLHPLLLPLPSSNGRRTGTLTRRPSCTCRKGKTSFGPGSKRASPLYRRFPPDPLPDLRGLIMLGSFEAR